MRVRFIWPDNSVADAKPKYEAYVDLPCLPLPGETVGIQPEADERATGEHHLLLWVEDTRWYLTRQLVGPGENYEMVANVEVWLTDDMNVGHNVSPVNVGELRRRLE